MNGWPGIVLPLPAGDTQAKEALRLNLFGDPFLRATQGRPRPTPKGPAAAEPQIRREVRHSAQRLRSYRIAPQCSIHSHLFRSELHTGHEPISDETVSHSCLMTCRYVWLRHHSGSWKAPCVAERFGGRGCQWLAVQSTEPDRYRCDARPARDTVTVPSADAARYDGAIRILAQRRAIALRSRVGKGRRGCASPSLPRACAYDRRCATRGPAARIAGRDATRSARSYRSMAMPASRCPSTADGPILRP